jgi:hypothetical protein
MITSFDPEYQATKLVKRGSAAMEPLLADLAAWIAAKWRVNVVNVIYDEPGGITRHPRLRVCVEHSRERQQFFNGLNFDHLKQQAIAARFTELVNHHGASRYIVDRLLVVFAAFAPLAREEADRRLSDTEIRALEERIRNPDLWTIHRSFGRVTFMFHTDEQARAGAAAGLREAYADRYLELLRKYDEFQYLRSSRFSVAFDSKENFDRNFGGSWFAYDR